MKIEKEDIIPFTILVFCIIALIILVSYCIYDTYNKHKNYKEVCKIVYVDGCVKYDNGILDGEMVWIDGNIHWKSKTLLPKCIKYGKKPTNVCWYEKIRSDK